MLTHSQEYLDLTSNLENINEQILLLYNEILDLEKTSKFLFHKYNQIFGEAYLRRFNAYMRYERLKRKLELIQYYLNHELDVDFEEVEETLDNEFREYQETLNKILDEIENAFVYLSLEKVSEGDYKEIKRIYYKIARKVHPDVCDDFTEEKKDLWQRTSKAYTQNDLDELMECEYILDNFVLKVRDKFKDTNSLDELRLEISKREEKIKTYKDKINQITNSFPYDQRELLKSEAMIMDKLTELSKESSMYEKRLKELQVKFENLHSLK